MTIHPTTISALWIGLAALAASSARGQLIELNYPLVRHKTYVTPQNKTDIGPVAYGRNGLVYIGLSDGVFEFDGVNQTPIPVPGNPKSPTEIYRITSLAADPVSDTLYVGCHNGRFGFVPLNSSRKPTYYSFPEALKDTAKKYEGATEISRIYVVGAFVYFYSRNLIFVYDKTTQKLMPPIRINTYGCGVLGTKFFVNVEGRELVTYENGKPGQKFDATFLGEQMPLFSLPMSDGTTLIGTDSALYKTDGMSVESYAPELVAFLAGAKTAITGGAVADDRIVIASADKGAFILNKENGKLMLRLSSANGLPDEEINGIMIDPQDRLWLLHTKHFSWVYYNLPLNSYQSTENFPISINKIAKLNKNIFVATDQGLLKLDFDTYTTLEENRIKQRLSNLEREQYQIQVKWAQKDKERIRLENKLQTTKYEKSRLATLRKELSKIDSVYLKYAREINKSRLILKGLRQQKARTQRAKTGADFDDLHRYSYEPVSRELRMKITEIFAFENSLLLNTVSGICLVEQNENINWISPGLSYSHVLPSETKKGVFYAILGDSLYYFTSKVKDRRTYWERNLVKNIGEELNSIVEDGEGNLWIGAENDMLVVRFAKKLSDSPQVDRECPDREKCTGKLTVLKFGKYIVCLNNGNFYTWTGKRYVYKPELADYVSFEKPMIAEANSVFWSLKNRRLYSIKLMDDGSLQVDSSNIFYLIPEPSFFISDAEGRFWVGGEDKLAQFIPGKKALASVSTSMRTLLRGVEISGDKTYEEFPLDRTLELPYGTYNFKFKFATAAFESAANPIYFEYKTQESEGWVRVTGNAVDRSFFLEGTYTFQVRARDSFGNVGEPAVFSFRIKPPWYLSVYAYIAYFLLFVGLIAGGAYVQRRKRILLERRNAELQALVDERTKDLKLERDKSEALLLNILPKETADELKAFGKARPKRYELVSVLFTDFKGFTLVAEKLSPEELIVELDYCFAKFDEIIVRHHVEKIKTIGDAYMCAAGLPIPRPTNPVDAVLAALEMQGFMNDTWAEKNARGEEYWQLRLGIHSGPLVAGVIGTKKFAYDIWGDTVNLASRMESSGEPGKINISGDTYRYVKDFFICTYRGQVAAKNKGYVDMYFVERLREEYSADPLGRKPNETFRKVIEERFKS
jgi:class 3 adenylate cyclase